MIIYFWHQYFYLIHYATHAWPSPTSEQSTFADENCDRRIDVSKTISWDHECDFCHRIQVGQVAGALRWSSHDDLRREGSGWWQSHRRTCHAPGWHVTGESEAGSRRRLRVLRRRRARETQLWGIIYDARRETRSTFTFIGKFRCRTLTSRRNPPRNFARPRPQTPTSATRSHRFSDHRLIRIDCAKRASCIFVHCFSSHGWTGGRTGAHHWFCNSLPFSFALTSEFKSSRETLA